VKCDEARPSCTRCERSGRTCDGYGDGLVIDGPKGSGFLPIVNTHPSRSEIDIRAFNYFKQNALLGLMGFDYKSEFWSQTILRFSEASPAVFRATLALSARHELIYNKTDVTLASESQLRFLRQYNKAIRQLCSKQSDQPMHFTLTCCIIFVCLESLNGNYEIALSHLRHGLKMLKHWHSTSEAISASEREARVQITLLFCRFDMQATAFLDSRRPELDLTLLDESSGKVLLVPPVFPSLLEAQLNLERLSIRLFYILTTNTSQDQPAWSIHNDYLPTRLKLLQGLKTSFENWKMSFDAYCTQESQSMQTQDLQLSGILTLHHQATSLMLDIKLSLSFNPEYSTIFNDDQFVRVNQLARSLINSSSTTKSSFSANMGVISSVYFAAMTASSASIRRESIELLGMVKGREGFWDAGMVAKIAERVLDLEESGSVEKGQVNGGIPALTKAFDMSHLLAYSV
jgi:hypothetical protein